MQTNNSKEKVRQLQNKLYLTAKKCDSRRFHALYDKVYRDDILFEAWKRVNKVQLPFALFSETFLTIRQNSLYVTVCMIVRTFF